MAGFQSKFLILLLAFSTQTELLSADTSCDIVQKLVFSEARVKEQLFYLSNDLQALRNGVAELSNAAEQEMNEALSGRVSNGNDSFSDVETKLQELQTKVAEKKKKFDELTRRKQKKDLRIEHLRLRLIQVRELCRSDEAIQCPSNIVGRDCADILQKGGMRSGVYFVQPSDDFTPFPAYCDQQTEGGGWTYIHSHVNDDLDFNRSWLSYKHGFGHVTCNRKMNFWIGNEALHVFTSSRYYHLRVNIMDWSNNEGYATYMTFNVESEDTQYRLGVGGYVEAVHPDMKIGDGFFGHNFGHADDIQYTSHDNMKFSTFDRDNDLYQGSCADQDGGGWWFNRCSAVNLNGRVYRKGFYRAVDTLYGFDNGMIWGPWTGLWYSLKTSSMKIRPASFNGAD